MLSDDTIRAILAFRDERAWAQFHAPQNLAKSIAIEAGELLECYQWTDSADLGDVASELADVVTYGIMLADRLGLDLDTIVRDKLAESRAKYPVDKAHGKSTKYDAL